MAVPKDKVVAVLKEKLKAKNHTKTFIDNVATRYAPKIETEDDIDAYVDDRLDDLIEAASEADRRTTTAVDKAKKDLAKELAGDKTPEPEPEPTDPIAKLTKLVEGLATSVSNMQAEKSVQTISEKFFADPRLKGLDAKLLKGRVPKTEAELEAAIEEAAEELKDYISLEDEDDATPTGATTQTKPIVGDKPRVGGVPAGKGANTKNAPAKKEEIDAAMQGIVV